MLEGLLSRDRFRMVKMAKKFENGQNSVITWPTIFGCPLFFRETRDNQEHDAKIRLPIPGPSLEKLVAEIIPLKKSDQ